MLCLFIGISLVRGEGNSKGAGSSAIAPCQAAVCFTQFTNSGTRREWHSGLQLPFPQCGIVPVEAPLNLLFRAYRPAYAPLKLLLMSFERLGELESRGARNAGIEVLSETGVHMCLCHGPNYPDHDVVPSRYVTHVGEIEVMVISDGAIPVPADILGINVDPAERDEVLRSRFLPPVIDWGLNVVVVRTGGRTILIDAGTGSEMPQSTRTGWLALRLKAAGVDPGSITDVIATHLHMDHIGGLLDERLRSQMRPDLRIHASAIDVEFFKSPDFSKNTFGGLQDIIRSSSQKFLDAYGSDLRAFTKAYQVAPGVEVIHTGGHTPGHSIVRISSRGERMTFAGDALVPVGIECPEWQNAFDHEPEDATRVRVGLLKEAAETGELFLASHLSFPALGRVAVDGKGYKYVPSNWAY